MLETAMAIVELCDIIIISIRSIYAEHTFKARKW